MTNLVPNKLDEESILLVENKSFEEERALFNLKDAYVSKCTFKGKTDGESPLKEGKNLVVEDSSFDLRYALWHNKNLKVVGSEFSSNARAPFWYCKDVEFLESKSEAIKIFRECKDIIAQFATILSEEPFWRCSNVKVVDSKVTGFYAFFECNKVTLNHINFEGKYSFQYINHLLIENSELDTKDAFWHSKNVVVKNSKIKGEYLGWYSKNVTFINCEIESHQPLCYAENVKLIDCKFINSDLAFENSTVKGNIIGKIDSIKNPHKAKLKVDEIGELIKEKPIRKVSIKLKK